MIIPFAFLTLMSIRHLICDPFTMHNANKICLMRRHRFAIQLERMTTHFHIANFFVAELRTTKKYLIIF